VVIASLLVGFFGTTLYLIKCLQLLRIVMTNINEYWYQKGSILWVTQG